MSVESGFTFPDFIFSDERTAAQRCSEAEIGHFGLKKGSNSLQPFDSNINLSGVEAH